MARRCIRVDSNEPSMNQVQQIVDSLLPDVPIATQKGAGSGFELLIVDRDALALELLVRGYARRCPVRQCGDAFAIVLRRVIA
jgi:hypothetical protein